MKGHNVCFKEKIMKVLPKLSLLPLLIWSTDEGIKFCDFLYASLEKRAHVRVRI